MSFIVLELVLIAIVYVSFSVIAQRKIANYKRIKEIKKDMDIKMKELRSLGSSITKEALDVKQKEITALASESMRHQLKPTLIVLPIFFLLFYVALPALVPASTKISVLSLSLPYTTFFIAVSFILGILSTIALSVYERIAAKKAQPQPTQQQANNQPQ